jgi:hypothetical protein
MALTLPFPPDALDRAADPETQTAPGVCGALPQNHINLQFNQNNLQRVFFRYRKC